MRQIAILAALVLVSSGVCAATPVVFANFQTPEPQHGASGTNNYPVNSNETISFTGTVAFEFENVGSPLPPGLQNGQQVTANITESFSSTESGSQPVANLDVVQGWSGMIAITLTAAQTTAICGSASCLGGLTNLLTVHFADTTGTNNSMTATAGGTSANLQASEPPNNTSDVVFSSDFLNFSGEVLEALSLSFLSSNPIALAGPGGTSGPFAANNWDITGQFQEAPGFVPEPASVVLIGGALAGLAALGRKRLFTRQ